MNRRPFPIPPLEVRHRSPSVTNTCTSDASNNQDAIRNSPHPPTDIRSCLRNSIRRQTDSSHRLKHSPFSTAVPRLPIIPNGSPNPHFRDSNSFVAPIDGDCSRLGQPEANLEDVREKLVQAAMLAERANALANEQRSNLKYQVSLQVPVSCLNQTKRNNRSIACEPVIELQRGGLRLRSMSLARMQESVRKLEAIRGEQDNQKDSNDNSTSTSSYNPVFPTSDRPLPVQKSSAVNGLFLPKTDVVLIGVANVYLRCLLFVSDFSYPAPIINPLGEVVGQLVVELSATILPIDFPQTKYPLGREGFFSENPGYQSYLQEILNENEEESRDIVEMNVSIRQASGISSAFSKMIFCHYNIFCLDEPVVVLPKLESFAVEDTCQQPERIQTCTFDDTRSFRFPFTQQFISRLSDNALSVEISGSLTESTSSTENRHLVHRMASNSAQQRLDSNQMRRPTSTTKLRRYKSDVAERRNHFITETTTGTITTNSKNMGSGIAGLKVNQVSPSSVAAVSRLTEDWIKLQRRIDLWVAIEELMEDGTYKKVTVEPSADVKTGGIYQLRQGLNRRIRILIRPSELTRRERGTLPLTCQAVTSVSVGCVSRSFADVNSVSKPNRVARTAPDSYQEIDLDVLRQRWCDAMDAWQSYLQENLQSLAKKKEKTAADEAREGYLLNRWVSSIQERDAIMVPSPGSSLPGAPASELPPPGMEYHNPLIFTNLSNEQIQGNQFVKVGLHSLLDGEERAVQDGKPFVNLPLIKKYATLIGAVASWDTNLHDDDLLNKITPSGERIYLIVTVNILVSRPILMTLVLRKRICIKIGKRNILTSFFRSPFSRMVTSEKNNVLWTGVAYQFVAGIPQMTQSLMSSSSRNTPSSVSSAENKDDAVSISVTENYAEQYTRIIQAVSTEIYLDGLRQEVALQEAISSNNLRRQFTDQNDLTIPMNQMGLHGSAIGVNQSPGLSRSRSFNNNVLRPRAKQSLNQKRRARHTTAYYPQNHIPSSTKFNSETQDGNMSDSSSDTIGPISTPTATRRSTFLGEAKDPFLPPQSTLSSVTGLSNLGGLMDSFRASTDLEGTRFSHGPRSPSEEKMAWTQRERDKQLTTRQP